MSEPFIFIVRGGASRHGADCPRTGSPLTVTTDEMASLEGESYPVRDGIPRFVQSDNYVASFGIQWNLFQRTQLDSYTGLTLARQRLRRVLGIDFFGSLGGRQVLEAGCGAGRFTEILLAEGACVTSIDLSAAVDANARNFPLGPNHRVAQADILNPPFPPGQFDLVVCLGVIQHTRTPSKRSAACTTK